MATFGKTFTLHDDYMTPKSAWENILHLLPRGEEVVAYEPFYGDGGSGRILRDLGINVILEDTDFYKNEFNKDCVNSNPQI